MIKRKPKECKGNHHSNYFEGCGKIRIPFKYGLCMDCSIKYSIQKSKEKNEKTNLDFQKAKIKAISDKSLKSYEIGVKKICHEYIRLRDKGKPCISCGIEWNDSFQAGHYHKAEKYHEIRFDEDNIHGQCVQCNIHFDGNLEGYNIGIVKRIGIDKVSELNKKASECYKTVKKWHRFELQEIKNYYKEKIKQLK